MLLTGQETIKTKYGASRDVKQHRKILRRAVSGPDQAELQSENIGHFVFLVKKGGYSVFLTFLIGQ